MDEELFWSMIEAGCRDQDPKNQLRAALQKLSAQELVAFQDRFDAAFHKAYRSDLWRAADLVCANAGGCTDDGFAYFRYSLILHGRKIYEAALRDPDSLAYTDVQADQDAGYLALDAYEAKTGAEMKRSEAAPRELAGSRADLTIELAKRRFPKLAAKYCRA